MSLFNQITGRREDEEDKYQSNKNISSTSSSISSSIQSNQNKKKEDEIEQTTFSSLYDQIVSQQPEKKQGLLSRIGKDTLNLFLRIGEGALDVGDFLYDTMTQISTSKANPYYWFNPDKLKSHQAIARELIKSSGTEYTKEKLGYTDKLQQKLNENTTFGTDDFAGQVVRAIGTEVTKAIITGGLSGGKAMTGVKLSPVISGIQGYGTGIEEAYQSGVENRTTANIAGIANAAVEFITDKLIPGSPGFRNLPEGVRTVKQALKDYGLNVVGEGGEEALAAILSPIVNEYIYTGKKEDNVFEKFISGVSKIDPKQVLLDGIAGMLVAGFLDSPQLMGNIQTVQQDKKANEAKQKFQKNVIQQVREEIQQELNEFINDENIDDSVKVKRIDDEIELINMTLTSDIRTSELDIEGLYNKKQELIKQRDELSKKLNEKQKIEIINELSDDVNEIINKAEETLNDAEVEVVQDKIEHIEKLTEEIDKNKKIKVAANKQKIKVNAKQHINEAAVIIEQMNMKLQEGQKPIQIVTELNEEQRQIMDLGSVFGKQVIFTENMPESGLVAQNNPNILFIDTKATTQLVSNKQGTTLYVLGHELFHSLKQVNPETYTQFVDYVKEVVTIEQIIDFVQKYDSENSNNILESLKIEGEFKLDDVKRHYLKYKRQNQTLGMIVEEMVANEFGGMFTDIAYMNKLYQSNPSLFSKVVNALRELFKSITGSVYNSSLTQLQVEKIRNDFETIVKNIQTNEKIDTKTANVNKTETNDIKNEIKNETKNEIDSEKKIQDVKPKQEDVKPKQEDVKTIKMDLDTWFKSINNMYQKYVRTKDKDTFSSAVKAYENYKRRGGTENIIEIDNYLQEQQEANKLMEEKKKQETIELMRKALMTKRLPKSETKESSFYSNTAKTNANDLFSDILNVAKNNPELRNYLTTSHDKDMRTAITQIRENPSQTIQDFLSKEKMTSVDTATAKILMMYYKSKNDVVNQLAVYRKIKTAGTEAGQFIESIKIFKNMSPEAIVQGVIQDIQSTIDALQNHPNREIQAWINENMNRAPLTDAEQDWIYQMANKALKLDPDSAEYRRAFALINKFVADRIPKSIASKLKAYRRIAMLFNLKTANRNLLGNVTMVLPNAFADTMGSLVDKQLSKKTGIRTQGTMNMKTSALSLIQGVKDANLDRKLGINTGRNIVALEITQGSSFNTKTKLGRTMNKIEELTNFIMDIGDRPFDVMYYENALQNLMKLNGVTEPTESMKQMALEEALKKTYKYEGKFYNFANNTRKLLNGIGIKEGKLVYDKNGKTEFGLGDITMPFIMTPANLLAASYHFSPIAVMSVAKNAKAYTKAVKTGQNVEFAQKALSDSIGKMTAGVALYAIGFMLAKSAITSGGEDEDKDVRATMRAMGYQPFSINIGDYSVTYDWMQPLANPIALFAELERQRKINENNPNPDKKLDNALKVIAEAFTIGADRLYEQSMLSGLRTIFGGNFGTQSITEGFVSFLSGIPQSFIPTLSKQLADMLDGTTKDTYSNDSLLYNTFSKFFVRIPGVKSALPSRKTILGEDMKMYGGENNLFNVMINPANISKDTTGIIGQEIMDVFNHTGDKTIFPQVVVNYIDYDVNGDGIVDRITFTPEQKSNLQERMGTIVAEGMKEILNNSVYVNASYEQKAKALTALMQYSKAKAIEQSNYVPNYEIKSGNANQINKYINEGLNIGDAVMYDSIINSIQGMKDSNGDSIKGSENGIKAWTIMNMQISDEAKNIMLRLISPTAKNPETVDSLQNLGTKQQFIDYYSLPRSDTFVNNKFSRDDYDISTKYFNIDGTIYIKFANDVSQIKADYNSKGEAIPNSRKNKVFSYINSLPLNQYQKIYLFSISGYSIKQWKDQMFLYINSLDISANEKKELWSSLGFE